MVQVVSARPYLLAHYKEIIRSQKLHSSWIRMTFVTLRKEENGKSKGIKIARRVDLVGDVF